MSRPVTSFYLLTFRQISNHHIICWVLVTFVFGLRGKYTSLVNLTSESHISTATPRIDNQEYCLPELVALLPMLTALQSTI